MHLDLHYEYMKEYMNLESEFYTISEIWIRNLNLNFESEI